MMNATLEQISQSLKSCKSIAISAHINPDGDAIGSAIAISEALRIDGHEVVTLLADKTEVSRKYSYLDGIDGYVHAEDYDGCPDAFIALDTSNYERLGFSVKAMERATLSISIDHHPGNELETDLWYLDTEAASCTMIVWDLVKLIVEEPNQTILDACYTGILTDTGMFQFQNTDGRCMRYAGELIEAGAQSANIVTEVYQSKQIGLVRLEADVAQRIKLTDKGLVSYSWMSFDDLERYGIEKRDTEGLVDITRTVQGTEIALLMRVENGKDGHIVRCNIRAKHDVDVSYIAKAFGGGGHVSASGFSIKGTFDEVMPKVEVLLNDIERMLIDGTFSVEDIDTLGMTRA